ncbi:hypothetical protein B0T16DRAFT_462086 [Cercophora newfieldiana]|uniref:BTB domain-containing protein n=1 Tax=Cercophora newfieldiana TaxID=92897 RepID=A0AA39XYV7_9PEZI|nr:hypothetical protein B0T16DRAFT_462086 [Cercophora newfieldiana]
MASGHDGLVNAVKGLYLNPEFSDLTLASSYREYTVHKAVVCPRSPYLADKCRDKGFASAGNTIDLKDDDAQAVHLIVEYLYNLDYTDTLPQDLLDHQPLNDLDGASTLDGFIPESPVAVVNGFDHPESPQPVAPLEETPHPETEGAPLAENDLDDFLPPKTLPTPGKKNKKKKGKNARAKYVSDPTAEPPSEPKPEEDSRNMDTPTPTETITTDNNPPPPAVQQPPPPPPQPYLTTHAKLYSLSAKYGITPLQSLALSKFQSHATTGWDANDFVHAAGEVYSSPLLRQENHAEMRRAVTGLVFNHRELLDGDGEEGRRAREILRGELGLDLIMRFREEGVW